MEVSTTKGTVLARTAPTSGMVICISLSSSSRNASNSSSALSISSMRSTTGSSARMERSRGRSSRYSSLNRDLVSASGSWRSIWTWMLRSCFW